MPTRSVFLIRRALALVAVLIPVFVIWFLLSLFQPFAGSGHGRVEVTIPASSGASQIGSLLERDGVISSGFFFKLRAALEGDRGKLRAGTYVLQHGMSYAAVLKTITSVPTGEPTVNLTIIPGRSRVQVQAQLKTLGVTGNYVAKTRRSRLIDPRIYGAPEHVPSLEGFLWPDTYQLVKPVKLKALIADQLTTFKQEFAKVNLSYARSKNLTAYDVLKIASLISEESELPRDGPVTASVIYNRLRLGMDLGLDSTVSYATGNYGALTDAQLNSRSPWNTTNHPGLPPTPIDSPDLAAIQAAAHPTRSDYLYFINRVCGNGALRFTANYAQFETWSAQYSAAVLKAQHDGGSPEYCAKKR
jgi:UPF0755 protein